MSAKWRAIQHRHRYTYNAVVFPDSYIESLNLLPSTLSSAKFFSELKLFISLNSVHAQVNHAKSLASAFGDILINGDERLVSEAAKFFLGILFLDNSLPLHRTLVSGLAKVRNFQPLIGACFRTLCDEHGGGKGKRFCVSRTALSVLGMPKLGYLVDAVEECAVLIAWDVVTSLNGVVLETNGWARPSPIVMEQCQEALSCLYYLLQRFPSKFKDFNSSCNGVRVKDSNVLARSLTVVLSILKSLAFSRDCFVAAGVSFCAALQVCLNPEDLGLGIMEGIFCQTLFSSDTNFEIQFKNAIANVPYEGDICSEILSFSALSRLCLIRGVLTAVPRTVLNAHFTCRRNDLKGFDGHMNGANSVRTILYDGILPELCNYCENPTDSHFNFHALTVMQICLQQIKTSMLANLTGQSGNYDPIPEDMGTRILRVIWNNLEDPLSQTVKQVHLIFDLFLDIHSSLHWSEGSERIKSFLLKIASDLLRLGPRCKGRYLPLASLTRRLGANTLMDMSPRLLFETIHAYIDDDICCAATSFLKCFLECLRDECWSSEGIESGYALYRGHCLPPLLYGLASGVSKLRSNLNTYALPVVLEIDVDSIFSILAFISVGPSGNDKLLYPELSSAKIELRVEQKVAILVSLLKVSRLLALMEGDIDWCKDSKVPPKEVGADTEYVGHYAFVCIKGIKVEVLVEWLVLALTHVDESLRVDTAEFLFLNPKTSSLPSRLELTLLKEAVPLNMRSCSTAFQMKWSSLFRKFFSRVRTALERQFKQGNWQPFDQNSECKLTSGSEEPDNNRANELFQFMRWLSCFLFFSCYPSAPYKRKIMAMDLILIMLNVWSILPSVHESLSIERRLCPYNEGITLPDSTLLLVGSVIDSWDRLRESSFRILLHFPTPLPGISDEGMVQNMIIWAKKLVCSPRVRESDAGALTLRLIFRKYVLELGWIVNTSVNFCKKLELENINGLVVNSTYPVIEYIKSLIDWLDAAVEEGERDLSEACKNSFVHGVLLALRYTFEELDFNSDAVLSSISGMRHLLGRLLELVLRITSLALWVVSADAWYLPEDIDEMVDDESFLLDVPDEVDAHTPSLKDEEKGSKPLQNSRSSEQVVMVGCWLAMKEVSLLLGTITRKIPLPSNTESLDPEGISSNEVGFSVMTSGAMLEVKQLETIGNHFLEVLLKMKHNGAIDKTRAGFTALCNRLLCSNDPRLCQLTESWMKQLMERTVAKGQTVDDLLRRSAGIPAAFIALFLSEPEGAPKKLLPQALRWLIDVANQSLLYRVEAGSSNGDLCMSSSKSNDLKCKRSPEMTVSNMTSKIRDEGVIPTVHAFNALRAAFNDTNLATDTSGFAAEALILSIRSFSSPYWEVRNSACLAYTALVRRMIGFLNVQKRDSVRRALTGLEFLHRYPSLHPFLMNELKVATKQLGNGSSGNSKSNLANVVHPSLCPMLILLSRLKPSTIAGEIGDELDPFLLMPFIRRCSTQSNLRVRLLASRALTGLVSNEKLPAVLLNIASELPCVDNQITTAPESSISLEKTEGYDHASFNWIHGTLLQLGSLLETNCRNLADFSKKDQILADLIQILFLRSWIATPRLCPCPILNASFLKVLDHMLSIARTCNISRSFHAIRNLLLELSSECLDVGASNGLSYYDPTTAELRQQAAVSYFSCVFQASEEVTEDTLPMPQQSSPLDSNWLNMSNMDNTVAGLKERLVHSLSDSAYEVRLATLKWLFKFLKSTESGAECHDQCRSEINIIWRWSSSNLQTTLLKLLDIEKNQRCSYYILRTLFTWNSLQFQKAEDKKSSETIFIGAMNCDSVFLLWDEFISLYRITRNAKTRETLMRCMGVCVKKLSSSFSTSILIDVEQRKLHGVVESEQVEKLSQLYDRIAAFTNLIKKNSASSESASMRMAAAESIIASGLLEQAEHVGSSVTSSQLPPDNSFSCFEAKEAVNMYACQILDIWFICIKLLEDEDDGIRLRLAKDVQGCFRCKRTVRSSHAGVVPTQVDKVIELSFEHLSFIFGHWTEYFDYLLRSILNAAENYEVSDGDLVRRVFDKEIDNHHEERLLICQICCSHLEKLASSKSWAVDSLDKPRFRKYLCDWRLRFSDRLTSFMEDHCGKHGGLNWLGGVGNHKDAFLPLYANLLGFYVLSNCIFNARVEDGTALLSDVVELGRRINCYLRNPLICNLYLLVVKSHEKVIGATIDDLIPGSREDYAIWDDFDPYFLLR
ncbi:Armadillo-type fold containing protein [Parasponia andersonii]|uniref:Armadillo-type fold containing protein n=1 Tax=Parasponia andersonii TaxID=3476 RepID=A0A2P5B1P8_PARAD|nr:Armadillo-type fold containing protein [Parasponia andersonii]